MHAPRDEYCNQNHNPNHGRAHSGFGVHAWGGDWSPWFSKALRCHSAESHGGVIGNAVFQRSPCSQQQLRDLALITHDLAAKLRRTLGALTGQVGVDTPVPVSPVQDLKEMVDAFCQLFPVCCRIRLGPLDPAVETRGRHRQPQAHLHHRVLLGWVVSWESMSSYLLTTAAPSR